MDTERDCTFDGGCPIFERRLATLPGMADLFRKRYCDGNHTSCARHVLAVEVGVHAVPDTLMPNDHATAQRVRLSSN